MLPAALLVSSLVLASQGLSINRTEHVIRWESYTSQAGLESKLAALASAAPQLATTFSLGKSQKGRDILGLRLAAGGGTRPLLRPMVKYVGNMHGDETVGREVLLALAEYLVKNYGVVDRVTKLLDSTEVHLLPTMNPDGYENTNLLGHSPTRGNANGVDLNRAFPTWKDLGKDRDQLMEGREKEVSAVMAWTMDNPFLLSINFHGGAVVANYPWDSENVQPWTLDSRFREHKEGGRGQYTPDNREFQAISSLYSTSHSTMAKGSVSCVDSTQFQKGITNGVDWYVVEGGMQDFNYLFTNCMEITLELSCTKNPAASTLQAEWESNQSPLLSFLEAARTAAHGVVTHQDGRPASGAMVTVSDRPKDLVTTERGEWWRLLVPGSYRVRAVLGDRRSREQEIVIREGEDGPNIDLRLEETFTPTTTTATTPAEEEEKEEGLKLNFIPGICVKLSWGGIVPC